MIIDDFIPSIGIADHHLPKRKVFKYILDSISSTSNHFITALKAEKRNDFNEDALTLVFVNQNQIQINKIGISIRVGEQYRDLYHKSKGIPDIYYCFLEEGKNHEPIFVMEAKRLPSPKKSREKEYVIGRTNTGASNGGIQRFKLEKHGKGLADCGMLGYVEKFDFSYWQEMINMWMTELTPNRSGEEMLSLIRSANGSVYLKSNIHREKDNLTLHHFWIDIIDCKT